MSVSNSPNRATDPGEQTRDLESIRRDLASPRRADSQDFTVCPPIDQLAQLVSGSLAESEAERLFEHIDRCQSCQRKADELARRRDPVLAAAQQAKKNCITDFNDPQLSRLIREAQIAKSDHDTRPTNHSTAKTVSPANFVKGLRRSGLLADGELNQVLQALSWNESDDKSDVSSLAKSLIENQKLTPFQAKLLMRGRWQGLVLGNYAILEKLGQGGMGAVFKARHTRMGREVCLKVVNSAGRQSPAVIERFRNEARTLAALSHPNIVVAHDANESKGIPYLVMEYVDGDDLAKRVRNEGPLSVAEALHVLIQTAGALQYAHAAGVIHRDIKPHNLVARQDPASGELSVKVLDLGLARFDTLMTNNPDASVLAAMTNTGVVIGTVDYMSPEQALDSRNADARSDIYSLGCTAYFLLTGLPPYDGETVMQRLIAHREQTPRSLCDLLKGGVTPALDAVVQKMLAKNPDARYQTMDELLADLQAVAAGRQPAATPLPVAVPAEQVGPPTEPSILDIQVEEQTAHVVSQLLTRRRSKRNIPWYRRSLHAASVAAACVVLLGILAFMLIPRTGAATAIRNGGDGRALIVVASDNFRQEEFESLTRSLQSSSVNVVAASPNYGTERKDFGGKIKAPYPNINLSKVNAADYDAVFVLGGNTHQLSHKNPEVNKVLASVVDTAFSNNVKVTGCREGYDAIRDTKVSEKNEYKGKMTYTDTCDTKALVNNAKQLFAELRSKK